MAKNTKENDTMTEAPPQPEQQQSGGVLITPAELSALVSAAVDAALKSQRDNGINYGKPFEGEPIEGEEAPPGVLAPKGWMKYHEDGVWKWGRRGPADFNPLERRDVLAKLDKAYREALIPVRVGIGENEVLIRKPKQLLVNEAFARLFESLMITRVWGDGSTKYPSVPIAEAPESAFEKVDIGVKGSKAKFRFVME